MFAATRQRLLNAASWKSKDEFVEYVEAWQYEGLDSADSKNILHGPLGGEHDILNWVRNGSYHSRPNPNAHLSLRGKIRLIICERTPYDLQFPISRPTFEEIESTFKLHPATLPVFENDAGLHTRYLTWAEPDRTRLEHIACIVKAPQKREICNWGLSLSYDVATCTTTALLYGTGVLLTRKKWDQIPRLSTRTLAHILNVLRDTVSDWDHPLLLPSIVLNEHMIRTEFFCKEGVPTTETVDIEQLLGVTKVGQSGHEMSEILGPSGAQRTHVVNIASGPDWPPTDDWRKSRGKLTRPEMEDLTVRINSHSTRMNFTARSPRWNTLCSQFLLGLLDEMSLPKQQQCGSQRLRDVLGHNIALGESVLSHVASLRERLALQLNVMYNFVAQMDNSISAELAVSAGRDSTSMKILAFISALFLPGSFIAGVFSMSVFDWQASEESGSEVMSRRFWIYWAVAIPLTALTVLGWATWWYLEMHRYEDRLRRTRGGEKDRRPVRKLARMPDLEKSNA